MTAFRPLMPETVSGRPGPEKLPLIASHIGMPSDKLLVLRILRSNHQQQYGSSNVSLPQGSPKTLSCSPKITASHIPRKTPLGNNALGVFTGSNVQGQEATSTVNISSSVADDVVLSTSHELNGGDAEDGSEEDWEDCSDCSTPNAFPAKDGIHAEQAPEDKKINGLVDKILNGRQLHFRSLPDEQGYQVIDETETAIAKAPEELGKVPNDVKKSIRTDSARQRLMDFDTQITPASLRKYRDDHNGEAKCGHSSSTSSSESSVDQGPWVIGIGHNGIEAYAISPIPFDIHQPRKPTATPPIESEGSELECTSPLFRKACAPVTRRAYLELAPPASASGEASRDIETRASINVWRDGSSGSDSGGSSRIVGKLGTILKDVSNTRQSLHAVQKTWVDEFPAEQKKERNQILVQPRRSQHLNATVATLQRCSLNPDVQEPKAGIKPQKSVWKPANDPERAVHFAAALNALDGHVVLLRTPEPLVRCADQVFGEDVLVDYPMPELLHPKPLRILDVQTMAEKMEERIIGSMWDYVFAGADLQDRPSNPTPDAAEYHYS